MELGDSLLRINQVEVTRVTTTSPDWTGVVIGAYSSELTLFADIDVLEFIVYDSHLSAADILIVEII